MVFKCNPSAQSRICTEGIPFIFVSMTISTSFSEILVSFVRLFWLLHSLETLQLLQSTLTLTLPPSLQVFFILLSALVSWVLHKIKKRSPLRYLYFWTGRGPQSMCKVLDISKQLLLGSYGQKKKIGHISAIFCFRTKFYNNDPPKMGKIIGVSELDFYSEIDF